MLSAWPWLLLAAAFLILPVLLRLFAGDEPDNAITDEQPGDAGRGQDPDGLLKTAAAAA